MSCIVNDSKSVNCINCEMREKSLFKGLDDTEIAQVELYVDSQKLCAAGEYIINEHDQAKSSYILSFGYVILGTHSQDGSRQIFQVALPGDTIGFGVNSTNGYFAQALTEVKACVISNHSLEKMLKNHSSVAMQLIQNLASNNTSYQQYLLNLGRKDARQALAYLIMDVVTRIKQQVNQCPTGKDNAHFFPLNQEDMADVVGITKVHVSRIISQFKKEGLIECGHKKLKVIDVERLADIGAY